MAYNYLGKFAVKLWIQTKSQRKDSFAAELPTGIFMAEIRRIGTIWLAKYISIQRLYA